MLSYNTYIVALLSGVLALHTAAAMEISKIMQAPKQARDNLYTTLQNEKADLCAKIKMQEGCWGYELCRLTNGCLFACDPYYEGIVAHEPEYYDRSVCTVTCGDVVDGVSACTMCAGAACPTPLALVASAVAIGGCYARIQSYAWGQRRRLKEIQTRLEQLEYARWAKKHPELVGGGGAD